MHVALKYSSCIISVCLINSFIRSFLIFILQTSRVDSFTTDNIIVCGWRFLVDKDITMHMVTRKRSSSNSWSFVLILLKKVSQIIVYTANCRGIDDCGGDDADDDIDRDSLKTISTEQLFITEEEYYSYWCMPGRQAVNDESTPNSSVLHARCM